MTTLARRGEQTSLLDLLDRLLDTGVVVAGDLTLSVAEVDLIFASLRLVVTSVDKAWETGVVTADGHQPPGQWEGARLHPSLGPADGATGKRPDVTDAAPVSSVPAATRDGPARLQSEPSGVPCPAAGPVDPKKVANGVAQLAVTIVDLLRQLLEREALRRMDRGTLTEEEIERLGQALLCMQEKVQEVKDAFNLRDEDLNLDLGPLGKLK